jgi:puromycin-sensitive aminopeptidase
MKIAHSGHVPVSQFLEFFSACGAEDNLTVWESINTSLAEIDQVLGHLEDGDALKGRFHRFVCKVVEPVAARYGWEPKQGEGFSLIKLYKFAKKN